MPSQEPIDLFVYGTLMDPGVVAALTGRHFRRVKATLEGFERIESGRGYPYILPKPGASLTGLLLQGVDAVSLSRFDDYEAEGDLYLRQEVEVLVAGRRVRAVTYVGHTVGAISPPPEPSPSGGSQGWG